jgi:hypothetical protein
MMSLTFEPGSKQREISRNAFQYSKDLASISFPGSVEVILGFTHCFGLKKVHFDANSRLRELDWFERGGLLFQLKIPASVEFIRYLAFSGCSELKEVIFEADSQIRQFE